MHTLLQSRNIDVRIPNAIVFLHLFVNLPPTFAALVKLILKQVCQKTSIEIYLVFDKTMSPFIKNC